MSLQAGFSEADISPPLGSLKVGWIQRIEIDTLLDPIFARVAIFDSDDDRIAFVQLDTICVRWTEVAEIRRRIETRYGFPGSAIMVSATHNHAGPAVASLGEVPLDTAYVESMVARAVDAFGEALSRLRPARIGIGSAFEWKVSHNRRMVMRDGTVWTHSGYGNPNALYIEGPIDPEVCTLVAKDFSGEILGSMVNFACHPTDHGGDTTLSAGFPGAMAREMKSRGCPVTLFLNGAAGNLSTGDPAVGREVTMEEVGQALATDAMKAIDGAKMRDEVQLGQRSKTLSLPFRDTTDEEVRGTKRGAQRFADPAIYDRAMPALVAKIRERGVQLAEVQALFIDEYAYVGMGAELFVQLGMRIKEECHPRRAQIVAFTNGYLGYVPHLEGFHRGGFETTFGWGSKLGPQAGDMLADCAIELVRVGLGG